MDISAANAVIPAGDIREVQPIDLDRVFPLLKTLSEPNRLRIFALLADGERCVCDIERATCLPQNLVSHHLRALREAELIECRRDGRWAYYRVNRKTLAKIYPLLCGLFDPDRVRDARAACPG